MGEQQERKTTRLYPRRLHPGLHPELLTIRAWARQRDTPEMPPQRFFGTEARQLRHARHRQWGRRLKQFSRDRHAFTHQPFVGRHARSVVKLPLQRTWAHRRPFGQRAQGVRQRGMAAHPVHQLREAPAFVLRHRPRHELRLTALAMRRHHEPLRDPVGDRAAVIAPHQMQQHVEPCRRSRRSDDLSFVDI